MSGFIEDKYPSKLGGGIPGANNNSNSCTNNKLKNLEVIDRKILRKSFNNSRTALNFNGYSALYGLSKGTTKSTPFRTALNAGDPAGTVNQYTNIKYGRAYNQISSSSLGRLNGLKIGDGVQQNGNAAWSGNSRYVYDSSDYTKFRKLKIKNQTYNDKNLGGMNASTVFTVLNRVRS